jgi:ornithine cyclodeaminase/alanine dehydrogenase-like protein (mu-crystallin family)
MAVIGNGAQSEFQALAFKSRGRHATACGSMTSMRRRPRNARAISPEPG